MAYNLVYEEQMNQDYRGHAEACTYEFVVNLPDQLGARWTAKNNMDAHISTLRDQGSILLEYRLWEDTSPTFSTKYQVQIVVSASPLFFAIIIIGVLAIIGLIVSSYIINKIEDIAHYAPGVVYAGAAVVIVVAAVVGLAILKRGT